MRISDWSSDVCSSDLDGERQHVLPALARAEDEEAVAAVVRDAGDGHHADGGGAPERREETEDQQRATHDLGDAGQPGVQEAGLHAQALEPPAGALDLAAAEDVDRTSTRLNSSH